MIKKIFNHYLLIASLIFIIQWDISAQVSVMTFSSSSGTYTEITGGTLLGSTTSDDQYFVDPAIPLGGTTKTGPGFPIGFDFVINGNTFDRFGINNNGWISFGKSALTPSVDMNTTSAYTPLSSTTAITPAELRTRVAGLGRDLQAQTGAELRFELIGTAPNRTLVIQWKGYRKFGATGDNYNFQVRINETSNTVEVVYGTMTNNTTSTTVQVGIGGSSASDFNNRTTTTDWTASTAGDTNSATMTLSNTVFPPSGLTFTWSPPSDLPPAISYLPLNNTSSTSNRILTAQITDDFGIASAPNDPRLYFKKKSETNFVFVNASSIVGNDYTFTIDYSLLSGPIAAGDTIVYYVAAQDNAGQTVTNPFGGSGTPPGINPPATFSSYIILPIYSLPYLQDFNAGTSLPANWAGNMVILANHGTSGSNGLTKNLYSSVTSANATSPIVGPVTSSSEIVFDYRIVNWSGYPNTATTLGGDQFFIRISTDDGANFTTIYTIDSSNHVVSTNFATVTIPIGAYAGQNVMVRWDLQWAQGDYYFDIDNVKIRETPIGPPNPAVVVMPVDGATNVAITTSLQWQSGGGAPETGYRIYFGTDGGGVTPPTNILNNVDLGLVTSYTPVSSLSYSTTYYWMIVPYNGGGDAPGNVIWSFTTGADPTINAFPYVQDFEGSFPPYGWQNYGSKLWLQTSTGGRSGSKGARVSYSPAGTANLQTPPVVLPAAPHRIKFWWKDNDISARPSSINGEATIEGTEISGYDTTYFEISTDAGTTWTSLAFLSEASPQSAYSEVVVDLTSYANQTVSFRWRDVSDGSFSAYGTGLDDITIEEIPATPIFVISPTSQDFGSAIVGNTVSRNFTISNTGSVTLTINSGGITLTGANADQFSLGSISYPINLTSGQSAQITVNFSPTSAGVKTANLQIVHNAPGSPAVVPLTGNALPLGTLFEDFTGTAFPPDGWLAINNDGGAQNWFRSTSKFNSAPASAASNWESSTLQNDDWLISPKVSVSAGDSLIFFSSIQSSTYPEVLVIKVGPSTDPNGSWTTLDSVVQSSTNWIRRAYSLSAFAGQNVYVAFVNRGLDEWTLYLDDIQGPVKYTPAVDLAFQDFYQSTGLPVPRNGEKFSDYRISLNTDNLSETKPFAKLQNSGLGLRSSNTNNTIVIESTNNTPFELNNVQLKGVVKNIGLNSASYNLNWSVSGSSQTPYAGPTVNSGAVDTATLTYSPTATGTFLTSGTLVVTGDEIPGNDSKEFRMRVYPDSYTRTIYDRADNVVDTWVGWADTTVRMKAGVRFTAPSEIKLAGVDFICRTEAVNSGTFEVQVRAAGDSAGAPGAVLYTQVYSANDYFAGAGDYIFFPFGNDAPTIASGSDYWITVKAPLGVLYPGAVHNTGFTSGRSFFEGSADTTVWNPLVITTERAWIMRAVHIPAASTFQLTVSVGNGWNMVSVPGLHPVDQNILTWWPGKDPAANVFKFQGAYQSVTTVQPGLGY
ncbi:Hypothetical protein IALB_1824 [Ignavibacterium album JCM 16511]|uniref:Choice-of-anchor D domain-containing protein n=1 Tax=Ignavibacterium album (strain DSM 19864 / JCM 16511 / NBRC 101810 / Mat9-16) TaxID=945713 RepID=I0AKM4_IGNAJ|nr:choice-of-anchor J domain-containing protein [Ignavibacterium album]AFH49531.1 Hypothetical protein IALB_1824 [Ignavibacterium album JCM 16511]